MKHTISLLLITIILLSCFTVLTYAGSTDKSENLSGAQSTGYVKCAGETFEVKKGDTFTYIKYLNVKSITSDGMKPGYICNIDGRILFDTNVFTITNYDTENLDNGDLFPNLYSNGSLMTNIVNGEGLRYNNYNTVKQFKFNTNSSVVFKAEFKIKKAFKGTKEITDAFITINYLNDDYDQIRIYDAAQQKKKTKESCELIRVLPESTTQKIETQSETVPETSQTNETVIPSSSAAETTKPTESTVPETKETKETVAPSSTVTETTESTQLIVPELLGDTDGDGKVSIRDATVIQMHLADLKPDPFKIHLADTDCDGLVRIIDATTIELYLAKRLPKSKIGKPV